MNYQQQLAGLEKKNDFFVGIDSDGCVFDSMEIKHKECFCPAFIRHMELQKVSRYAREVWEYVNLYSKYRGLNRFLALLKALELLSERAEVVKRGWKSFDMSGLKKWTEEETRLGQPALESRLETLEDEGMQAALNWSKALNKAVEEIVYGIEPLPGVKESLEKLCGHADIIVVSQTPLEALDREWKEHGIDGFINMIAAQEHGTKQEHLELAAGSRYDKEKCLMIGDAPGDLHAAQANGMLFYPIIPGREEDSWQRFFEEASSKFFNGTFAGLYQKGLLAEFDEALPSVPPWES